MKKLIVLLIGFLPLIAFGQIEDVVNVGTAPDANDGDSLRRAFQKVNAEFAVYEADSSKWLHWADTLTKISTSYDISLKLNSADALEVDNVSIKKTLTVAYVDTAYIYTQYDAITGLALKLNVADSTAGPGHYASNYDLVTGLATKATPQMISDSLANLAIGMNLTTDDDSIVVIDNDSLKFVVKNYSEPQDIADSIANMKAGIFNVLDYDTPQDAIDAAIAATPNGTVYFPAGEYLVTDTLVVNGTGASGLRIYGNGELSILHTHTANLPILKLQDCVDVIVENISIQGNGAAFGVGATNDDGLYLDHARYCVFKNVNIQYNGRHGVYGINGTWGNIFTECNISNNLVDGINSITISSQENTGQNGNAISLSNCIISGNGDDGIEWAANQFNCNGSIFEANEGSGIQIGSLFADASSVGINITGSYFENNDSAQILLQTKASGYLSILGCTIEGNYLNSTQTDGLTSLIVGSVDGSYSWNPSNVRIGTNYYYKSGGVVVNNVNFESSWVDVTVTHDDLTSATDIVIPHGTHIYGGVAMAHMQEVEVVAGDGITASQFAPLLYIVNGSAIDISANPQIAAGLFDGQRLTLVGQSDTNTLTLEDGNGLQLAGAATFVMGAGDIIELIYIDSLWREISRSNN